MKLEFLLSRAALFVSLSSLLGLALNALPLALFAAAASVMVLLIMAGDYAHGRRYARALARTTRRGAVLPLAA